jgi:uncharacterized membrane protein YphA (DoxX/SURF4 family)
MNHKLEITESIIRIFAGILFFFQGYDKLFKVKISGVTNTFLDEAEHHHIHRPLLTVIAAYTSVVEFAGGIALLLGFFTHYALYLLGIDLLLAAFAFSLLQPMWDMKHLFPRFVLVIALLLLPDAWNKFSIDYLMNQ